MSIASSTPLPALMFAAFATIAVAGCGLNVGLDDDTTRRVEHDTLPADGLRRGELTTDNGEVQIRGGGDEIAARTVLFERHERDADDTLDVDGDRLVVQGECDRRRGTPARSASS